VKASGVDVGLQAREQPAGDCRQARPANRKDRNQHARLGDAGGFGCDPRRSRTAIKARPNRLCAILALIQVQMAARPMQR